MYNLTVIHQRNGESEDNAAEAAKAMTYAEIRAAADAEQDMEDDGWTG